MLEEELIFQGLALSSFFGFLTVLIIIIAISSAVSSANKKRKSQYYRKFLTDLYVAAKIRFFAKEDNLDLVEEEKSFKDWLKKDRRNKNGYDLDDVVESELMDRVEDSTKKEKKEKKETK
jgi:hypothetical protein